MNNLEKISHETMVFMRGKLFFMRGWNDIIVCVKTRQNDAVVIGRELCVIETSWQL